MSDYEMTAASDAISRPKSEDTGGKVRENTPQRQFESSNPAVMTAPGAFNRASSRPQAKHEQAKHEKAKGDLPEQVLRAFNTWAFKREQPSDPQLLLQFVARAVAHHQPIPMLFYWGKGPRCEIDGHDHKCMEYLGTLARRIAAVYPPGAAMRLIFTDTHARLNGYSELGIANYFASVETEARRRGLTCCWLSDLIETTRAKAEDYTLGDVMPEEMLAKLSASAMKWYHGQGTPEEGAVVYFHMNMIEKRAVELSFPDAIFVTFNSSKFRILFPKRLPIFYMYSMQRGVSVKPWFLPAEARPCTEFSCHCAPVAAEAAKRD
jgi:hypothetical protein